MTTILGLTNFLKLLRHGGTIGICISQKFKWFLGPQPLTTSPIYRSNLYFYGDVRKQEVAAAVYAVVKQEDETTQGLVRSKSRNCKEKSPLFSRLELMMGHMAGNLISSVETALGRDTATMLHCS